MPNFRLTEHSDCSSLQTKLLRKRDIRGVGLSSSEPAGGFPPTGNSSLCTGITISALSTSVLRRGSSVLLSLQNPLSFRVILIPKPGVFTDLRSDLQIVHRLLPSHVEALHLRGDFFVILGVRLLELLPIDCLRAPL